MSTIDNLDKYLSYYGNTSLDNYALNEADYLYFSLLSYIHLEDCPSTLSYYDFCLLGIKNTPSKRYGRLIPKVYEMVKQYRDLPRYQDFKIEHYQYIINDNTQFGALVLVNKKHATISFTGSDGTVIGWYENFRGGYMYPTCTQLAAQNYLKSIINKYSNLTLLGHSKGGNLAIASTFGLTNKDQAKIEKILNFDGPGFPPEVTYGPEYKSIEDKITNYIPEDSYIGSMLYHGGTTLIIKSLVKGLGVHFPSNWEVYGGFLVEGEKLSEKAQNLHHMTTDRLDRLDRNEIQNMMENAFNTFTLEKTSKLKVGFKDLVNGIKLNQKYDLVTRKQIHEILQTLVFDKNLNDK